MLMAASFSRRLARCDYLATKWRGMKEFIEIYGYYGAALGILATGLGFPVPEEVPVLVAGAMANHLKIYIMLPICIVSVIIGDTLLYTIGRVWGSRLVQIPLIRKRFLTPERFAMISANFQKYGMKILLFARVTPGIRTWIFLTAGITKLPLAQFVVADSIYAVPGVTILFFLGYYFTDSIIDMAENDVYVRPIIVLVVLAGIGLYLAYRMYRKPMVTGNPTDMPPIVGPVTETLEGVAESMAEKVLSRSHSGASAKPATPAPPAENNGEVRPAAAEEKKPANQ
jgi:membrane protein DedA with SNARE-associated domain